MAHYLFNYSTIENTNYLYVYTIKYLLVDNSSSCYMDDNKVFKFKREHVDPSTCHLLWVWRWSLYNEMYAEASLLVED